MRTKITEIGQTLPGHDMRSVLLFIPVTFRTGDITLMAGGVKLLPLTVTFRMGCTAGGAPEPLVPGALGIAALPPARFHNMAGIIIGILFHPIPHFKGVRTAKGTGARV